MSISFWQADQNYQNSQQSWAQQLSNSSTISSVLTSALQNQQSGLASLANVRALIRVNSQIAAASGAPAAPKPSAAAAAASAVQAAAAALPTNPTLFSNSVNSQSGATAASLLSGQLPMGSLLSILA
jgi:hypothetical protein